MKSLFPTLALLTLAACGGADPTPPADESATATEINASVEQAEEIAANAQLNVSGYPDTNEGRADLATNIVEESERRGTAGEAREGASGLRPSPVDPGNGDTLQVPR
jgi:predicted small lipoprotein YifL